MGTYSISVAVDAPGKRVISPPIVQTDSGEARLDAAPLAGNAVDATFNIAFKFAAIKALVLFSTQPCTIKTNDSLDPGDIIELAPNRSLVWDDASPYPCPFTEDVTKFHVTNDSNPDAAGALTCLVLMSPSP